VSVTRVLVQVVAQLAVFLEFADDATLHPDAAVKQLEALAFQLQQLPPADRREFTRLLDEVADEWSTVREREYLHSLPAAIGIT
jgi:hypothetical protein